jgi:hypothetical protein
MKPAGYVIKRKGDGKFYVCRSANPKEHGVWDADVRYAMPWKRKGQAQDFVAVASFRFGTEVVPIL